MGFEFSTSHREPVLATVASQFGLHGSLLHCLSNGFLDCFEKDGLDGARDSLRFKTSLSNMGSKARFTNQAQEIGEWNWDLSNSVAWGRPSAEFGMSSISSSRLPWLDWQMHGRPHMEATAVGGEQTFPTNNSEPEFSHINKQTEKSIHTLMK